jgi:hypothetical protein
MSNKLLNLEKEGKYVFHGSPDGGIDILIPKQGKHFPNPEKIDEFILDGAPAVSATPYLEFAIFRALVNGKNAPGMRSGVGFKNGNKEFRISSEKVFDSLKDKKGFVYVFDKKDFKPYSRNGNPHEGNMEWRAYEKVKPLKIIGVNFSDIKPFMNLIKFI